MKSNLQLASINQPIQSELGTKYFTQSHFYKLYGKRLFPKGNWVACYDEQEKLGLIMAYDTRTPFLTHLWMNTSENPDSHYSYIEIQPWIKINTGTTTYFSHYLYGFKGSFDEALKRLKLFTLG